MVSSFCVSYTVSFNFWHEKCISVHNTQREIYIYIYHVVCHVYLCFGQIHLRKRQKPHPRISLILLKHVHSNGPALVLHVSDFDHHKSSLL